LGLDDLLVVLERVEEALFSFCDSVEVDHDDGECCSVGSSSWIVLFWSGGIFTGGIIVLVDAQRDISKSHTTPCFLQLEQVGRTSSHFLMSTLIMNDQTASNSLWFVGTCTSCTLASTSDEVVDMAS
jgi:hypothetical protein